MSSLCHYPLHHSAATVKTLVYSDSPRSEKYSKWYKKGSKGWFDLKIFLFFSEWEAYFFHGIGWCGSKETEVYNLGSPLSDQENDLSERSVPEWIFFCLFHHHTILKPFLSFLCIFRDLVSLGSQVKPFAPLS